MLIADRPTPTAFPKQAGDLRNTYITTKVQLICRAAFCGQTLCILLCLRTAGNGGSSEPISSCSPRARHKFRGLQPREAALRKLPNFHIASEIIWHYGGSPSVSGVYGLAGMPGEIRIGLQNQEADNVIPKFLRSWYYIKNIMAVKDIFRNFEQGGRNSCVGCGGARIEGRERCIEKIGDSVPVRTGWELLGGVFLAGRTDNAVDAKRL